MRSESPRDLESCSLEGMLDAPCLAQDTRIVMDYPDLPNLIKRMKAITAAVRARIEEIEAKDSPLARKTHQHADLQAIREEGDRIRKAMTALFRTQEYLLRTDRDRWTTERSRLNDEIQEKFAALERAVAEYRRRLGLLPFRR
jgi:predicted  nucleic acid-binding Zn-ribbon protein